MKTNFLSLKIKKKTLSCKFVLLVHFYQLRWNFLKIEKICEIYYAQYNVYKSFYFYCINEIMTN